MTVGPCSRSPCHAGLNEKTTSRIGSRLLSRRIAVEYESQQPLAEIIDEIARHLPPVVITALHSDLSDVIEELVYPRFERL